MQQPSGTTDTGQSLPPKWARKMPKRMPHQQHVAQLPSGTPCAMDRTRGQSARRPQRGSAARTPQVPLGRMHGTRRTPGARVIGGRRDKRGWGGGVWGGFRTLGPLPPSPVAPAGLTPPHRPPVRPTAPFRQGALVESAIPKPGPLPSLPPPPLCKSDGRRPAFDGDNTSRCSAGAGVGARRRRTHDHCLRTGPVIR